MPKIGLEQLAVLREQIQAEAEKAQKILRDAQEELKALDVIERRIRSEMPSAQTLALPGVESSAPSPQKNVPFAKSVRDAVNILKGILFDVQDVERVLRQQGIPLPGKNLRTRITVELIPLHKKGIIEIVARGTGNIPNRYKLVADTSDASAAPKGEGVGTFQRPTPSITNMQH